mmetsp:Transcript_154523/g.474913  ORF Transcript_154523/g.474913 Transcript_154523/m.474913 type:complete len:319 (-) Transcript_154523:419-1375(-)
MIRLSWSSKTAQAAALSPSSLRASARALSSESETATTTATASPRSLMLRMCSLPMAPVPTMPTRRGAASAAEERGSGGPRSAASTRRGGSKLCRACMTSVLSTRRTSPSCHAKATWRSCMKRSTTRSASPSTGDPSPSTMARSPSLRASYQPVKAAITELKNTRLPVRLSRRRAGRTAVVVRQSPFGSHSKEVPCRRMAASASSLVATLYVSRQERPKAESVSVVSGITRMYRTPSCSILLANAGKRRSKNEATSAEGMMGVAPPADEARSQWKSKYAGGFGACASSWWKGMGWSGGDSFDVNTTPGTSSVRGAAPPT